MTLLDGTDLELLDNRQRSSRERLVNIPRAIFRSSYRSKRSQDRAPASISSRMIRSSLLICAA